MPSTLHEGTSFLICTDSGDIGRERLRGSGIFYEDSRFLSHYELYLNDEWPIPLGVHAQSATEAVHYLVNPLLEKKGGGRILQDTLAIRRRLKLDNGFFEELEIENFGDEPAVFQVKLKFWADFENIFVVKRMIEQRNGSRPPPRKIIADLGAHNASVLLRFSKAGVHRQTHLRFNPRPSRLRLGEALFEVSLARRARWGLKVTASLQADNHHADPEQAKSLEARQQHSNRNLGKANDLRRNLPEIETDHAVLQTAVRQAMEDLISLRVKAEDVQSEEPAIAAGIPWYMALFGRDSLLASFQSVYADPSLARGTLRALARLQGVKVDKTSQEEPGKILHEYRQGRILANNALIPKFPYYGTIDATVLFLITLSEYVRFSGDLEFAKEMLSHAERALDWMVHYGDRDGDGFLEYIDESKTGLPNQGWKDSWDSVRFRSGSLASAPIALVEVQGYAHSAYRRMAELFRALGRTDRAEELDRRAHDLGEKIIQKFWLEDRQFFSEALDGSKRPVDSLTSNSGQLLWSQAIPDEHAKKVVSALMSEPMYSGFGIRTMGSREGGFNPISYHNGSVWPHDNSLIVHGMSLYGMENPARKVIESLLRVLGSYPDHRFPELFSGFSADETRFPIEYPSACRPQAWASGAILLLFRCILGLEVNSFDKKISCRPIPIAGASRIRVTNLKIAGHSVVIEISFREGTAVSHLEGLPPDWMVGEKMKAA